MKHFIKGFLVTLAVCIGIVGVSVTLKLWPILGLVYLAIVVGFINYKLNK